MVRIGNFRFGFERAGDDPRLRAADYGKAMGPFFRQKKAGYKPEKLEHYYRIYYDEDLVRLYIDDLVEAACGTGYYTTVEVLTPVLQKSRSKELVDRFGQVFNLDHLMPNIARNVLIAGFCPVEVYWEKGDVANCALKIIHPMTVKHIEAESGEVKYILQDAGKGKKDIRINGKNLAWFNYCQIGNDVRGTSIIRSAVKIINTLNKATSDVNDILDRYLSPLGIWRSKGSVEAMKKAVANRASGEDIFIGDLSDDELLAERLVEFITLDPRVPFWEYIEYMDRRVYAVFRGSNLWFVRNATQASARIMEKIVARHVRMIQRDLKRGIEGQFFEPLVTVNNLPEVPKVKWNPEPTGIDEINIDNFLMIGLQAGYISEDEFRTIIRYLGVPLPRIKGETDPRLGPHSDAEPGVSNPKARGRQIGDVTSTSQSQPPQKVTKDITSSESLHSTWLKCTNAECGYRMINPGLNEMMAIYWACPKCKHQGFRSLTNGI
jgi:hypothetical protein